ncbi:hypothetical protein H0H87_003049, partial [Tephrocybe sp. NHM501043]
MPTAKDSGLKPLMAGSNLRRKNWKISSQTSTDVTNKVGGDLKVGEPVNVEPTAIYSSARAQVESPAIDTAPDTIKQLDFFFEHHFPTLVPSPLHTKSSGTREPSYFDKHLDSRLILRKVAYLPTLAAQLEVIVDDALTAYLESNGTLPPINEGFPTKKHLKSQWRKAPYKQIVDEASLERIYRMTMAQDSACVAATLEFQLPVWSPAFLSWSTTDPNSVSGKAIADGFLTLNKRVINDFQDNATISQIPRLSREYSKVTDINRNIGIWEFKSLTSGKLATFAAILDHANMKKFPWVSCEHGPLCVLNCSQHSSTRDVPDATPRVWIKAGPNATPLIIDTSATSSPPGIDVEVRHTDETHATHILQQLWAEMVNNDVTFACLNAGIYELIVMRDRVNNVLYLSNLLSTDKPGFGKRHTGLFIAMLRDAKQRSSQVPAPITINNMAKGNVRTVKSTKTFAFSDPKAKQRTILEKIRRCNWVVMDCPGEEPGAYKRNSPYARAVPRQAVSCKIFGEFYRIQAHPHKGISLGGTIKISGVDFEGTEDFGKNVVVKCAGVHESIKESLLKEAEIYQVLQSAGVACIPEVLGFFRHANFEEYAEPADWMILVLENVGSRTVYRYKSLQVMQSWE